MDCRPGTLNAPSPFLLLSTRLCRTGTAAIAFVLLLAGALTAHASAGPDGEKTLSAADQAFREAFHAMERKQWKKFARAAKRVPRSHVLYDYIQYWQLRHEMNEAIAAEQVRPGLDRRVTRFINRRPMSLTSDLLRKKWMLEQGRREQWNAVLRHLPKWQRRNDTRVFCYAGRAHLARNEAVGEQVMDAFYRDRNLGEECGPLAAELLASGVVDTDFIRRRMWRALEVRDWRSVQTLAELLGGDPDRVTRALKKSSEVLREFEAMPDKPRTRLPATRSDELLIALVRVARARPKDAAQWMPALGVKLHEIERRYLWGQIAASAMRDMIPEAYDYTLKTGDAPITDITRQWLARAALRQQDWRLLIQVIGQMDSETQSFSTWIYWRARAMMALGEQYGAQAMLKKIAGKHHFYGQLAAEELGVMVATPAPAPRPSARMIRRLGQRPGFVRARKFYEMGIRYQGNREWNYQARGMNDAEKLAVAHHACQQKLHERCISMANRTREQHDFALRFISPFRPALAPVAARHGLDLSWVYGLIRQESRFAPDARSVSGARGLMQIMPATGRWIARKMGVKGFKTRHLYEPTTNLDFGAYYLRAVYDDLHNSPLLASAAYNAGPRRPRHWISTLPGDVDGALFVEIIPFSQTRTYVKKVLLNTAYYESVFSGKPQSLKSLLGDVPHMPFQETRIP